jgi:hypothetical protein
MTPEDHGQVAEFKTDNRKHYPSGTCASVDVEAMTDEPQTKARGEEFQELVRDVMLEARAALAQRLVEAGFTATVKIVDANCSAWFPADHVEWREDSAKRRCGHDR